MPQPAATPATPLTIDRSLTMGLIRVVERTAVVAARYRGRGDERAADLAVAEAMRHGLSRLPIRGRVVIGEGSRDDTPVLFVGEEMGAGRGPKFDIAVDALDNTTACVKDHGEAVTAVAVAEEGSLLRVPNVYMDKIAIGPGYPAGLIDLDAGVGENLKALARAKGVAVSGLTACILDRPRHARLIGEVRASGAAIRLIGAGDVAGVIHVSDPERTGVDIYLGSGGAPEGVLAAAALKCLGGQMKGRFAFFSEDQARKAKDLGLQDLHRTYDQNDMASGDVVFAMAGVTEGLMLEGVRFKGDRITTHTIVLRASSGTARDIRATHRDFSKFTTGQT